MIIKTKSYLVPFMEQIQNFVKDELMPEILSDEHIDKAEPLDGDDTEYLTMYFQFLLDDGNGNLSTSDVERYFKKLNGISSETEVEI